MNNGTIILKSVNDVTKFSSIFIMIYIYIYTKDHLKKKCKFDF